MEYPLTVYRVPGQWIQGYSQAALGGGGGGRM